MSAKLGDGNPDLQKEPMFKQLGFSQELYQSRLSNSKKLLFAAWTIEIIAATIGLAIAGLTAFATYQKIIQTGADIGANDVLVMFIGALPFIMVAVVEIMKIPLVTVTYHAKSIIWKAVFGFALFSLAMITFETAMNGFQRNFSTRSLIIDNLKQDRANLQAELGNLENQVQQLTQLTSEEDSRQRSFDNERTELLRQRQQLIDEFNATAIQIEARYGQASLAEKKEQQKALTLQIDRAEENAGKRISAIQSLYNDRMAAVNSSKDNNYEQQRATLQILEQQVNELREEKIARQDDCGGIFGGGRGCREAIATELDPKIKLAETNRNNASKQLSVSSSSNLSEDMQNELRDKIEAISTRNDEEVTRLTDQRSRLSADIARMEAQDATNRDSELERITNSRNQKTKDLDDQLQRAQTNFESQRASIQERQQNIPIISEEIESKRLEIINIDRNINNEASDMQIYQIAQMAYGMEAPSEVTTAQVRTVLVIWFGSLASIIAFTGILLAFGAMVLKYEHMQEHGAITHAIKKLWQGVGVIGGYIVGFFRQLYRTVRGLRWLILSNARRNKLEPKIIEKTVEKIEYVDKEVRVPVEVIKEVPVEKIVVQEVAKETIVKEFVYVPFYTTDPDEIDGHSFSKAKIGSIEKGK